MKALALVTFLGVAPVALVACNGMIGDAGPGASPGGSGGAGAGPMGAPDPQGNLPYVAAPATTAALPARVWRLTHAEYRAAVLDFVGVGPDTAAFEIDNVDGTIFQNASNVGFVRTTLAASYYQTAERVAGALTEAQLRTLAAPCTTLTAACKADFIRTAVRRGFRRAATADDMTELGDTFDLALPLGDALLPFRSVVQQMLTSPHFLYRTEVGAPEDAGKPTFRLTGHEVASLLSFSLLGRPPSATLLAAADRGELGSLASMQAQVAGLLASPEAAAPLRAFLGQWTMLDRIQDEIEVRKHANLYPAFEAVRPAMLEEANAFLLSRGGMTSSLAQLLTAPVPPAAGALGAFYSGAGAQGGIRTGFLGLGAFLSTAAHADIGSPTLRGLFVRRRLLCQDFVVPQNVPSLSDVEQMGAAPKSTRDLYQLHKVRADCAVCHNAIDPVGFAFEDFDGAGRYRTQELFRNQTVPVAVDTSGRLINTDVNREFANHTELAQALASSDWVRECSAIHAFRYYMGLGGDVPRGSPAVIAGYRALAAGGTIRELVSAVMTTDSTIERTRN